MRRFAVVVVQLAVAVGCGTPPLPSGSGTPWGGVSSRPGPGGGVAGGVQSSAGGGVDSSVGGGFNGTGGGDGTGFGGGGVNGQPICSATDTNPVVSPSTHAPPPVSGGTMTVLADGTAVVADSDRDQVYLVSTTGTVTTVALSAGDEPGRVVEGPSPMVFVALRGSGQVVEIDHSTGKATQHLTACSAPRGLAFDASAQVLWVACSSGELAQLTLTSPTTYKRAATHPVDDLRDVLLFDGQLLATTFRDATVWSISAEGTATKYARPAGLQTSTGRSFTPQVAWRTVATSAGLVMSFQEEETTALPPSVPCAVSAYGTGNVPTNQGNTTDVPTVGANLALFNNGSSSDLSGALPVRGALPVDVAASPDGSQIAVAYAATNQVSVTLPAVLQTIALSAAPVSLAWRGQQLLVYTRNPAMLTTYAFGSNATPVVQSQVSLSFVDVSSTGHDLFHVATQNQIACASCHPEAGDDGHVWNLQEGIRRTPSLRGGLSGTEPFHWSGEESDINTLMTDIFTVRMGGFLEDPQHTEALMGWLDAQPTRPAPADLDQAAVARGASQFTALGCDSCHSGSVGTNNSTVDVGTGEAFQVPRLVELAYRAPFFHDGSVPSLAARFTALGGAAHPGSSGLNQNQISDLVAYLKTR